MIFVLLLLWLSTFIYIYLLGLPNSTISSAESIWSHVDLRSQVLVLCWDIHYAIVFFFQVQSPVNLFPITLYLILCTFTQTSKLKCFLTLKFLFPTSSQLPSPVKLLLYFFFSLTLCRCWLYFPSWLLQILLTDILTFYLSFQVITAIGRMFFQKYGLVNFIQ